MNVNNRPLAIFFLLFAMQIPASAAGKAKRSATEEIATGSSAVMWREPADIRSRNLFYGSGGKEHAPRGPFTFIKEDLGGTNPKFVVEDRSGNRWKVKLGIEARPETAASRIVWAAGYDTDDTYFVRELDVRGMPARLLRGQKLRGPNGAVRNVLLEREAAEEKKTGKWQWRRNPFSGTRELNGLKVIMAVINNWDLKDENTAIYQKGDVRLYRVSDLGASFGTPGRSWPTEKAKGNLLEFERARFIRKVTDSTVDFQAPARPRFVYLLNPKEYCQRVHMQWIGRKIPLEDVRWMGRWLARLSSKQIQDAFRAAGYSPQEVDEFTEVMERRIAAIRDL